MSSDEDDLPRHLLELLARGDTAAIARCAADEVTFSSPVADYHGREDVVHLLGLIARVLKSPAATETTAIGPSRLTAFTARVEDDQDYAELDGILRESYDESGRLVHATLFLRPLASLRQAIGQLARLLADAPLPGSLRDSGDAPRPGRPVRGSSTGRPIMALFDLAGRRWVLRVIWELHRAPAPPTFRALRQSCGDISSSVLTRRLAELTEDRLVRHDGTGYALTATGRRLVTALQPVLAWSHEWADGLPPAATS
jgi:DNA-binding HxlR family transcriptional regulator